jgi:glycosyltransferase involved in cell wall biosynthesis
MSSGRILFVCMHRPNRSPGQRYRFEQYLPDLRAAGFECEMSYLIDEETDSFFYQKGHVLKKALVLWKSFLKRKKELQRVDQFDAVFIFREALMTGSIFFERALHKKGIPTVFDFDDSIWLPNVSEGNKLFQFIKKPEKTAQLIAWANVVFAGSPYLKDYASQFNNNVELIPTTIDLDFYNKKKVWSEKPICIGWTGSITTIAHFRIIEDVLLKLKNEFGQKITFKVIGDGSYSNEVLQIQGEPWNAQTEVEELLSIDIGIMPLPEDEWSRGKCACKGLQFMALGIPVVMSNVGVNKEVIRQGENGFVASSHEMFYEQIKTLILDSNLRKQLGDEGRKTVVERYSRQAWREKYVELFKQLVR